jgi:phenylacetate-CoA ligase
MRGYRTAAKLVLSAVPVPLRQSPAYWRWRHFLREAHQWPAERIVDWQLTQFKRITRYAYENTEGYRELYRQAGIKPGDIRTLADVRHLPFTDKFLLQRNLEAFSVQRIGRRYVTTGGSTGIPFGFYNLRRQRAIEDAFIHTARGRFGWKLGQRLATLRGNYVGSASLPWKYDGYWRELSLSSYQLTSATLPAYLDALNFFRPPVLQAYPSALNLFVDLLRASGRDVPKFDLILLASENAYDWQLRKFDDTFRDVTLCCHYGHCEKAIFAPWCEGSRVYHIEPFYGLTELLRGATQVGEGEDGELVGTSFHGLATPFIRYRTMDRAVRGKHGCEACGRPFETLASIEGRLHEMIETGSGRYISMTAINMHDRLFDTLQQFQFFQERAGHLTFKYVQKRPLSTSEQAAIQHGLDEKLGEDVILTMQPVDSIPRTSSGKYRFLDQRLQIKYSDHV